MKVSQYEIILPLTGRDGRPVSGKKLLVNGLYKSFDVAEADTAEKLLGGNPEEIPAAVREKLAARGHITRKTPEDEAEDARLLGRIWRETVGMSSVGLVIMPTYDCNFRCPYCFERHRLERGNEWLSRRMTPEMTDAVFSALRKQQERGCRVKSCCLYGGEPLMRENADVVRNICEHAREMKLKLSAVTNGYDLDAYLDLLAEFAFDSLQITVDGVGAVHDRRRLHRDGVPTYGRIMDHIAGALERGINVRLRVNVNRGNIGGIPDLIGDLSARGLRKTNRKEDGKGRFEYYFKAVEEDPESPAYVTEREVMDAILAAGIPLPEALELDSQYNMVYNEINRIMEKRGVPFYDPTFCGAERGALVVGPEGQVHTCWNLVGIDGDAVGFTDQASGTFLWNFNKAKWRLRTSDRMPECLRCPYIFFCRGGCAVGAKRETGSYFREFCGEFREFFASAVSQAAGKKWEESGESELSVSLCGPVSRLTPAERMEIMNTPSANRIAELARDAGLIPGEGHEDKPI